MTLRGLFVSAVLACASAAAAQSQAPQLPTGTAVVSGRVVSADTGQPIRGAIVSIGLAQISGGNQKRAVTDADGKYQLTGLGKARYSLTATADRHLSMQFGQQQPGPAGLNNPTRPIDLIDGEQFTTADFKLSRTSAIEGIVTDEFGDPAPNVAIQVSQVQYAGGRRRLLPTSMSGGSGPPPRTDDKGEFRIFGLAPGDYYVSALSGAFADATAAGGFAVTFFPGTVSANAAQPVTAPPGRDAANVNFSLTPASMARIAGTLVDGDGKPLGRSSITLMPNVRSGTSAMMMVRAGTDVDGSFVFRNVPPGAYTIQAFGRPLGPALNLNGAPFGWMSVAVDGKDLDNLIVKVPAPRNVRGSIIFEGNTSSLPKPEQVRVQPMPVEFESSPMGGGPSPMKVNDDWTFEVNAMSGVRAVVVSAPGWTLKRITQGGQDITDVALDLREHDQNGLEISLTTQGTTVSGTVVDATDGTPSTDYNVVIFAQDELKWTPWSRYVAFVRPNQQGLFMVKGMPAGNYLAVALPVLANGEWQDPEFLQKMRAEATRFSLIDGGTQTLQLKMKK